MNTSSAPQKRSAASVTALCTGRTSVGDCEMARRISGRRGLLVERLLELGEEAHILDGNHRLCGEGLGQGDLVRCERPGLGTPQHDGADALAIPHHGDGQTRPEPVRPRELDGRGPFDWIESGKIGVVEGAAVDYRAALDGGAVELATRSRRRQRTFVRDDHQLVALTQADHHVICAAEAPGRTRHHLEDRLHVGRRPRDDAQNVGSRGLLLQRLTLLDEQPGGLQGDDGLAGEGFEQRDLPVVEGTYFLAVKNEQADRPLLAREGHLQKSADAAPLDAGNRHRQA